MIKNLKAKYLLSAILLITIISFFSCNQSFLNPIRLSNHKISENSFLKNFYLPEIKNGSSIIRVFKIISKDKEDFQYIKYYFIESEDGNILVTELYNSEKFLIEKSEQLITENEVKLIKISSYYIDKNGSELCFEANITNDIIMKWVYEKDQSSILEYNIDTYSINNNVTYNLHYYIQRNFSSFDRYGTDKKAYSVAIFNDSVSSELIYNSGITVSKDYTDKHYFAENFGIIESLRYLDGELIIQRKFVNEISEKEFIDL